MKEIDLIYKKIDFIIDSLEKESKLKIESPLFSEFLYNKLGVLGEHKIENKSFGELQMMSKRLLSLKENKVPKSLVIPGNVYYFTYLPKGRQKMDYWDRTPCIICLGKFKGGFYGLNLNLLDPLRRFILLRKIPFVSNQDKYELLTRMERIYSLNDSHKFYPYRTYFGYKSAKVYLEKEYKTIFRKYLYGRMIGSPLVGHIPFKYFKILSVLDLFDFFPRQNPLAIWIKTRKDIIKNNRK